MLLTSTFFLSGMYGWIRGLTVEWHWVSKPWITWVEQDTTREFMRADMPLHGIAYDPLAVETITIPLQFQDIACLSSISLTDTQARNATQRIGTMLTHSTHRQCRVLERAKAVAAEEDKSRLVLAAGLRS
jgi:hypothetical protein